MKTKKLKTKKLSSRKSEAIKLFSSSDPIVNISKDLKEAAALMPLREAKYCVNAYYSHQQPRIRSGHLVDRCEESDVPTSILRWAHSNFSKIESDIQKTLGIFAAEYSVGQWLQSIPGIAGVLSAGFLTTFDIRERLVRRCNCADKHQDEKYGVGFRSMRPIGGSFKDGTLRFRCTGRKGHGEKDDNSEPTEPTKDKSCKHEYEINLNTITVDDGILVRPKTVGHWYNFVGMNPKIEWEKNKLRPWNANAKVLCYKAGESFVKVQNRDNDIYGHLFAKRKDYENEKNEAGEYREQALEKSKTVGKGTIAYRYYSNGKLPPAHIYSRARRWAVKIFLSHFHDVCYRDYYGEAPPVPFVFSTKYEGHESHIHYIPPPEFDGINGKSLRQLYGEI